VSDLMVNLLCKKDLSSLVGGSIYSLVYRLGGDLTLHKLTFVRLGFRV
jgi:hypothetical protein